MTKNSCYNHGFNSFVYTLSTPVFMILGGVIDCFAYIFLTP